MPNGPRLRAVGVSRGGLVGACGGRDEVAAVGEGTDLLGWRCGAMRPNLSANAGHDALRNVFNGVGHRGDLGMEVGPATVEQAGFGLPFDLLDLAALLGGTFEPLAIVAVEGERAATRAVNAGRLDDRH